MSTTDIGIYETHWSRTLGGFTVTTGDHITVTDRDGDGITADRARILAALLEEAAEELDRLTGTASTGR